MDRLSRDLRRTTVTSVRRRDADPHKTTTTPGTTACCPVCRAAAARYSCPSCEGLYCSAACFAHHDARCAEAFFKAHVKRALKRKEAAGEATPLRGRAQALGDVLRQSPKNDESPIIPRDRLEALAAGAVAPTPDEERLALRAALGGELALTPWVEWWRAADATDADVVEWGCASASTDDRPVAFRGPATRELLLRRAASDVAPLPRATTVSPLVANSALEVLCAYARTARYYDGEHADEADAAAAALVDLCGALAEDARHATLDDALDSARRRGAAFDDRDGASSSSSKSRSTLSFRCFRDAAVLSDVSVLVAARPLAVAALLDAWRVLALSRACPKKLRHKLRFLTRWMAGDGVRDDFFPRTAILIREARDRLLAERDDLEAAIEDFAESSKTVPPPKHQRPLITVVEP